MAKRVRTVHVINSFEFGGAEAMLCSLLLRTNRQRFEPTVVTLINDMTVAEPLLKAGIPIVTMRMKPGVPDLRGIARLARHLERLQPSIVQTWMDHSNLIGGIAARVATRAKVVWGIHHSDHVLGMSKRTTLMTVAACARLSRCLPARIVFCSEHARRLYTNRGFAKSRMTVIPNGFDTAAFRPDSASRIDVRRELGLEPQTVLIGLLARYAPQKDHGNFLRAAALVAKTSPAARFMLCGDRVDANNPTLMAEVNSLGLSSRCHLLGPRRDVARLHAALDVAVSSSITEAFPLVVGEAMSCGVPCAVTDVGDSALMVGDTGRVVPLKDSPALAGAINELVAMGGDQRRSLGMRARQRVCELFDLDSVTRQYEGLYDELALDKQPDKQRRELTGRSRFAARLSAPAISLPTLNLHALSLPALSLPALSLPALSLSNGSNGSHRPQAPVT